MCIRSTGDVRGHKQLETSAPDILREVRTVAATGLHQDGHVGPRHGFTARRHQLRTELIKLQACHSFHPSQ